MAAALYDVFVVGPSEPGPTAEARLCATLATQSGRPVTAIARALAEKNLRVGHGVESAVAERLVRELLTLGAATAVTASGGNPTQQGRPPAGVQPPPSIPAAATGFSLTPLGGTNAGRGGTPVSSPSLKPLGAMSTSMPGQPQSPPHSAFAPPGLPSDGPTGGRLDPPSGLSFGIVDPAPAPAASANAFTVPGGGPEDDPVLELATRDKAVPRPVPISSDTSTSISSLSRPAYTLAGASALNTSKIVATSSASGLSLSDDEADHTTRCPTHGLLFDKRKTKGCRRCVEGRRSAHAEDGPRRLRDSPARRAFLGFGLAFALGLLPAAFYAKKPGAAEVERLRGEQHELSQRAGTEDILRRFDEIDGLVSASQMKNMRNTLFIWVAVGGLVMVGFYKAT